MFEKLSLKSARLNLHSWIYLHAVDVACYAAFIQAKSSTNCNGIFQKAFFKHEQGESEENYEKTTEKGEI